jgi:hypothetical protein
MEKTCSIAIVIEHSFFEYRYPTLHVPHVGPSCIVQITETLREIFITCLGKNSGRQLIKFKLKIVSLSFSNNLFCAVYYL